MNINHYFPLRIELKFDLIRSKIIYKYNYILPEHIVVNIVFPTLSVKVFKTNAQTSWLLFISKKQLFAKYSKFAKVAGKGLGVLGVGLDVYGRVSEGQTMTQTAAGVGTSMAGAYGGAQLGASIGALGGPLAPFTVPLGGLIGGIGGYFAGGKISDMVTGVGKPKTIEQTQQTQKVQESLDNTTQLLTVVKNIELLV